MKVRTQLFSFFERQSFCSLPPLGGCGFTHRLPPPTLGAVFASCATSPWMGLVPVSASPLFPPFGWLFGVFGDRLLAWSLVFFCGGAFFCWVSFGFFFVVFFFFSFGAKKSDLEKKKTPLNCPSLVLLCVLQPVHTTSLTDGPSSSRPDPHSLLSIQDAKGT